MLFHIELDFEGKIMAAAKDDNGKRKETSLKGEHMADSDEDTRFRDRLTGSTRFLVTIPVIGLFISAVAMTVATLVRTIIVTYEAVTLNLELHEMLVEYIEFADYFLLAIVLYIMSIGLYSLFIDNRIDLPPWLKIRSLDDLKEKLVSVVIVVMGVFFLGKLLLGAESKDLAFMGIGIGAVILSLAYFVKHIMSAHNDSKKD